MDDREARIFRAFFLSAGLVVALGLAGVFLVLALRSRTLLQEEMLAEGRALFSAISVARKWNSGQGGVYVEGKDKQPNPFLETPEVRTTDGRTLVLKNPATMTREISAYAAQEGLFTYRITSLKLINPANAPDSFEEQGLKLFEAGGAEHFAEDLRDGRALFRYMAPLKTEESCLTCHRHQGYRTGDVRGAISVSFDVKHVGAKIRDTFVATSLAAAGSIVLLLGLIRAFLARMQGRLAEARHLLERAAATDSLTGLANRGSLMRRLSEELARAGRQGSDLACVMVDLDHFKDVNDRFGHLAGDEALKRLAALVGGAVRPYDVLGRFGGEEFLLVLPGTSLPDALALAERLRGLVEDGLARAVPGSERITASFGVATRRDGDTVDDLVRRADEALYRAKEAGRNRVEAASSHLPPEAAA